MITTQMMGAVGLSIAVPALLAMGPEVGPGVDQSPTVYSVVPDATALEHEYKPRTLMLRFKESASAKDRAALLAEIGATVTTHHRFNGHDASQIRLSVCMSSAHVSRSQSQWHHTASHAHMTASHAHMTASCTHDSIAYT